MGKGFAVMELKRNVSVIVFMIASTIGAGIFALPFTLATHGLLTFGIVMVVVVWAIIRIHDATVQLSASTHKNLQIPGLIHLYLGKTVASFSSFIFFLGEFLALLVYTLGLFEIFLLIFPSVSFAVIAALCLIGAVLCGLMGERFVLRNSFFFSVLVFFLVFVISLLCIVHPDFSFSQTTLVLFASPISVIAVCFFSLSGLVAIPELAALVRDRNSLRLPIGMATFLIALLYAFFAVAVVGLLQKNTTSVATVGLQFHFGTFVTVLGLVVTFASFCSGLMLRSLSLVESLRWDYGFSKNRALLVFSLVYIALLQLPFHSFAIVVSFAGGVIGGLLGILVMLAYIRMKYLQLSKKRFSVTPAFFSAVLVIVICFLALFRVV